MQAVQTKQTVMIAATVAAFQVETHPRGENGWGEGGGGVCIGPRHPFMLSAGEWRLLKAFGRGGVRGWVISHKRQKFALAGRLTR